MLERPRMGHACPLLVAGSPYHPPGPYDPPRAMKKKGIWTGGFPPETPMERRFALAGEAGFEGVELVVDERLVGADAELRALADLASRTVPIHSLICGFS